MKHPLEAAHAGVDFRRQPVGVYEQLDEPPMAVAAPFHPLKFAAEARS